MVTALRFGAFELDLGRRSLTRDGTEVHLPPKGMRLLEILIERSPNAVSKQDLHDEVWQGTFVSEATLASLVAELRGALEDDAESPSYIKTLFGFGYAFCADVAKVGQESNKKRISQGFIESKGGQTALVEGEHVIGRDPEAAVFIDDGTVSRQHARLTIRSDKVTLEDLGSKNGTYVNGKRIRSAVLEDGSEFHVGGVRLIFRQRLGKLTITWDRSRGG